MLILDAVNFIILVANQLYNSQSTRVRLSISQSVHPSFCQFMKYASDSEIMMKVSQLLGFIKSSGNSTFPGNAP